MPSEVAEELLYESIVLGSRHHLGWRGRLLLVLCSRNLREAVADGYNVAFGDLSDSMRRQQERAPSGMEAVAA